MKQMFFTIAALVAGAGLTAGAMALPGAHGKPAGTHQACQQEGTQGNCPMRAGKHGQHPGMHQGKGHGMHGGMGHGMHGVGHQHGKGEECSHAGKPECERQAPKQQ